MLFTIPAQWVVLGLALVGGWLLGLASHPGGRRWRDRYLIERDAHAATRREQQARVSQADARAKAAESGNDARIAEADRRIAHLEQENARLAKAAPVTAATITRPYVAPLPVQSAARPADPLAVPAKRGWFDWERR